MIVLLSVTEGPKWCECDERKEGKEKEKEKEKMSSMDTKAIG